MANLMKQQQKQKEKENEKAHALTKDGREIRICGEEFEKNLEFCG